MWTENSLWLTSADECLWFTRENTTSICDSNGNYLILSLTNNNLVGTLPLELMLLSKTLGKTRCRATFHRVCPTNVRSTFFPDSVALQLQENAISGSIQTGLTELSSLGKMVIRSSFKLSTQAFISPVLRTTERFDLSNNKVTGYLATEFGTMVNLGRLLLKFYISRLGLAMPIIS